jgi:endonuclease III
MKRHRPDLDGAMKTRKSIQVKPDSPRRLRQIERRLRAAHGQPRHHNPSDPLEDLIFVLLSRMTQEVKYLRTYQALRREMPTWGAVRDAPADALEDVLQDAGLAPTKSRHIQAILKEIEAREGALDLSRLHGLPDEDVEAYLATLPGVARKTARCVMLYALGRETCPVDAHVWRVMKRLGVAPDRPWSEAAALRLEESIPREIRSSLHVTLVSHGRKICRARSPRCQECVLRDLCPSATE